MMLALVATLLAQCVDACCVDPNADRSISGYVTFPRYATFADSFCVGPGICSALSSPAGISTTNMAPPLPDQTLRLYGRKRNGDQQSGIVATAQHFIDGGIIFSVSPGGACQAVPIFNVRDDLVGFGQTVTSACASTPDKLSGSLVDESSLSGHVSLRSREQMFLTIGGGLSERRDAKLPNGEDPPWGDGTRTQRDGADRVSYVYAGMHGDVAMGSVYGPRRAGFLAEWFNPVTGTRADHRAFIDVNGAYSQNHQLTRAQFPPCPADSIGTSLGTFYYGALESTLMYAFDEHRWYSCSPEGWRSILYWQ